MRLPTLHDDQISSYVDDSSARKKDVCSYADASALVARVASSPHFAKAPKLKRFLSYVAEKSLAGRLDLITEYRIGVEVFERRDSYSTNEDNIVRSYARTLRRRLEEYFASEGSEECFVLSMPRGGYALEIAERVSPVVSVPSDSTLEQQSETAKQVLCDNKSSFKAKSNVSFRTFLTILFLVIVICTTVGYLIGTKHSARSRSTPNVHRFWNAALGHLPTMIVPSDTGLTVTLGLIQKEVSVQDYVKNEQLQTLHQQFPSLEKWDRPITHRYSDFVDVLAVHQFDATPELSELRPTIRYARDLKADEIDMGNILLLGGSNANPWVQLFDRDLNFHLRFLPLERTFRIENLHPTDSEQASYPYDNLSNNFEAYGLVAVLPNPSHSGNVILMEGTTNSGLQASFASLASEEIMTNLCRKILRPDGSLIPFEMLVKTPGVGGNATRIEVLGVRTYP